MESQDARFWWIRWLSFVGLMLLLMFLRDTDRSHLLLHSAGIVMIVAGVPFMRAPYVRYLQSIVLGTLIADVVFRNAFAEPPFRHSGITARWIGLAGVYCLAFVVGGWFDHKLKRSARAHA